MLPDMLNLTYHAYDILEALFETADGQLREIAQRAHLCLYEGPRARGEPLAWN